MAHELSGQNGSLTRRPRREMGCVAVALRAKRVLDEARPSATGYQPVLPGALLEGGLLAGQMRERLYLGGLWKHVEWGHAAKCEACA
jgi:hypothetical protein